MEYTSIWVRHHAILAPRSVDSVDGQQTKIIITLYYITCGRIWRWELAAKQNIKVSQIHVKDTYSSINQLRNSCLAPAGSKAGSLMFEA